jgi:pyridoxal phosphate enzyme (YggS family)
MVQYQKGLQDVLARIEGALTAAGRPPGGARLVAVSKTFPAAAVREVYGFGQRAFGENYVQEAVAKMDALADLPDVEWHLIGPLQSNKTGVAAARFDWIHTVDRARIAERLSRARPPGAPPLNVLVQVNISGEATKSGVAPDEALPLAREVAALPRLALRGFMGIAAPTPVMAARRAQYRILRALLESCRSAGLAVDTLSMGMSDDIEAAVAEGATIVRVGTAIFGLRGA